MMGQIRRFIMLWDRGTMKRLRSRIRKMTSVRGNIIPEKKVGILLIGHIVNIEALG